MISYLFLNGLTEFTRLNKWIFANFISILKSLYIHQLSATKGFWFFELRRDRLPRSWVSAEDIAGAIKS